MQIDHMEPVARDRSRIVLDTGEKFILYKGEIRTLKLKEGCEISDAVYSQIMKGVLTKRSRLRAMNLLKSRDYTEYQLSRKLLDAEYPPEIVDQAMDYVKSFHYIDDHRYAVEFIKEQFERHSRKELYQKLQQKGISREILDAAFDETYGDHREAREEQSFNETEIILKTLKKRGFTGQESYEEKQKLLAYFYRRGFDMDAVYEAMDKAQEQQ